MDLPQGDIARRYKVLGCLGRGNGCTVYLVSDAIRGGRHLALKAARIPKSGSSSWLTDLRDEFATLSLLRHPNLARVHDFGNTATEMYFTSEWVDGRDILAATEGLDFNLVFSLLVQMLQAVDFIHRRGILHLDLKPANILVQDPEGSGESTVKLIDFGISQWTKIGRRQEAGYIGTPPFAAPELIEGQAGTGASDIYSLGMIFHLILCRRFPFASQNPFEILAQQGRIEPQAMGRIHPALPLEFSDLLRRMVARDPKDRFLSAAAVLEAFNQCLGENFSMRGETAPIHILEENEISFHPDLIDQLVRAMSEAKPKRIALIGPKGSGKTRILQRVKSLLQLQGRRAYHFGALEELELYFETSPTLDTPLLLDFDEHAFLGTETWLRQEPGQRMILASEVPIPWAVDATLTVPPLAFRVLNDFIQEEIRQAPFDLAKRVQDYLNPAYPHRLENLLQAFRDLKLLAWSENGWHWQGEAPDLAELEARYLENWQRRKNKVREILESSGLGLPASVLEGMIGVDPGFLEDRLASWGHEDWLDSGWQEGCRRYFCIAPNPASESPAGLARDPAWLRDQFQALYDAGKFGLGVAWARTLKNEGCQAIPPQVAIHAARHWVAEGDADQALAWLPASEPEDFAELGLFHEIRARALQLKGDREKAGRALSTAETSYRKGGNLSGL
ncbi:MAG TPA: serine/threonine-protein kinase, partial [bacterium]|nr:serine/threonine-protein kinase [bacterium]